MSDHLIDRALLEPVGESGRFQRQPSTFREWVSADGSTPYPAGAGRYHLYISWACPWAHRTVIGRRLKGLEDVIGMSVVDPIRDERGWAFTGGEYTDPVNGFRFLGEAYAATAPDHEARLSVPVLWDKETKRIVNNESADILRMYTTAFDGLATRAEDHIVDAARIEVGLAPLQLVQQAYQQRYGLGAVQRAALLPLAPGGADRVVEQGLSHGIFLLS